MSQHCFRDAFVVASLAEKAGIDLRIVVLKRNAGEILKSVFKRGFNGESGSFVEPRILIDAASAVNAQLSLLDPRFIHCIDFQDYKEMSHAHRTEFLEFISPHLVPQLDNITTALVSGKTSMNPNPTHPKIQVDQDVSNELGNYLLHETLLGWKMLQLGEICSR
jgi:hypothetical protein